MLRLLALFTAVVSCVASADLECNVDLQFGLVVNKDQIRVIDQSRTVYQINGDDQLIVGGEWLALSDKQKVSLKEFSDGVHYVVPKMILLAGEGVDLAIETVEHVYVGLVGKEHESYQKLQRALERVKGKIRKKFIQTSDSFYMGPGRLENVDDLVDRELEEELEVAIKTSLGGVLSAIGGLTSGGDEETERKIEGLSQRLEVMGEEIERQVAPKADSLKKQAKWFCKKFKYLDKTEDQLRRMTPQLKQYNVIMTDDKEW